MFTLSVLRELDGDKYKCTYKMTESETLPLNIFLFRKDINNAEIYQNVVSIDDLQKYNPLSPILFTKSIAVLTYNTIASLENDILNIISKLTVLERDYKKYLIDHKFDNEEIFRIDDTWV